MLFQTHNMPRMLFSLTFFFAFYLCVVHAGDDDYDPCKAGKFSNLNYLQPRHILSSYTINLTPFVFEPVANP